MEATGSGLAALIAGLALCFAGYRFFRFLLPVWGFIVGFWIGSTGFALLAGTTFLADLVGWVIGAIFGVALAVVSYLVFRLGLGVLAAGVGASIGGAIAAAAGDPAGTLAIVLAIAGALIGLAVVSLRYAPKTAIAGLSAIAGASTAMSGVILLVGEGALSDLSAGGIGAVFRAGPTWFVAAAILASVGFAWQMTRPEVEDPASSLAGSS